MFKTRTQATRACDLGRVSVNGVVVKAHRALGVGDRVEVWQGDWQRLLVVKELRDLPLPKAEAPRLYEDQSLPRPVLDPIARLMRRPGAIREKGAGRPTKKERRDTERWRGEDGPEG